MRARLAASEEFECPHGVAWDCGAKRLCPPAAELTVTRRLPQLAGLGDVLEMLLARIGLRAWLLAKLGEGCGCETRKTWLNRYAPMWAVCVAAAAALAAGIFWAIAG